MISENQRRFSETSIINYGKDWDNNLITIEFIKINMFYSDYFLKKCMRVCKNYEKNKNIFRFINNRI